MSSLTSPGLKAAADNTIVELRPYLERLQGCALDFSADFLKHTKTISVPVIAGAAETFNADSANYSNATGTIKYVDLTCSTHKKCTFELDDVDCLEIDTARIWTDCAKASANKIGPEIVKAALGLLTYTSAESQKTVGGVTVAGIAALAGETMAAGYDPMLCTLFLEPTSFFTLIGNLPSSVVGDGSVIKTARIDGSLFGFGTIQAAPNVAKASSDSANKGIGFVVPYGAIAVAARLPKPPNGAAGYVEIGEMTDEVTGFSLGLRVHVDPNKGKTFLNVESLFGAALTKSGSNGAPGYIQVVTA